METEASLAILNKYADRFQFFHHLAIALQYLETLALAIQ
jgi:hypothetical protein